MITHEQVLEAARRILLQDRSVTDGWRTLDVALDAGQLLVTFTWQQLPYRFAVRFALDDLAEGVWTGMPVDNADEWVHELSGLLMEEFDTGAAGGLPRVVRGDLVELLIGQPRLGQLPPEMRAVYYVDTRGVEGDWFMLENGLDPKAALDAHARRQLRAWWNAYVNNAQGLPLVAQLVVTGLGQDAHLAYLQVRDDLPEPVPDVVIAELIYSAVWSAACEGARRITCSVNHPALPLTGLQRDGDLWFWQADGPVLTPPDLVPPFSYDAERAALLAQYRDDAAEPDEDTSSDTQDWDALGAGQAELHGDVDRLVGYGQAHPQTWGGLRFNGTRLVVSFTDPDAHRGAVRALVQHPDRVDVVVAKRAEQERERIRREVIDVLQDQPGTWIGVGMSEEHVNVDLLASGLPLAEQLWAEHGDALLITVAGHRYPLDQEQVANQPLHPGTQQTASWPDGLQVEVEVDQSTVVSGRHIRGALVLRATTSRVRFESDQPLHGELLDEQGRRVNDLSGMRIGTGWSWDLAPGQSGKVPFSASTASARLADGPHVPAGAWSLIVPIPVHEFDGSGPTGTTELIAGPFNITLAQAAQS